MQIIQIINDSLKRTYLENGIFQLNFYCMAC